MTFKAIYDFVHKGEEIDIYTLGGSATFKVKEEGGALRFTNSRGSSRLVNEEFFDLVLERINQLDDNRRMISSSYTSTNWFGQSHPRNPDTVFAPYAVALYFHVKKAVSTSSKNISEFLENYDFLKVGEYYLNGSNVDRRVHGFVKISERVDLVYAFFVDGVCTYIGKSIQGYSRPLGYHRNPVMITVFDGIKEVVENQKVVEVLVRRDNNSIVFKCLSLSLIEPIEQALTSKYLPAWNKFVR
jgi:hypothetical protein